MSLEASAYGMRREWEYISQDYNTKRQQDDTWIKTLTLTMSIFETLMACISIQCKEKLSSVQESELVVKHKSKSMIPCSWVTLSGKTRHQMGGKASSIEICFKTFKLSIEGLKYHQLSLFINPQLSISIKLGQLKTLNGSFL